MKHLAFALSALLVLGAACAPPPQAAELPATSAPTRDPHGAVRATAQALYESGRAALEKGDPRGALADLRSARNLDPDRRPEIVDLVARVETRVAGIPTATPAPPPSPVALFLAQPTGTGLARLLLRPTALRRLLGTALAVVAEGPLDRAERGRMAGYRLELAPLVDRPAAPGGAVRRVLQEVARYGDEELADAAFEARAQEMGSGDQPVPGVEALLPPVASRSEVVEEGSDRLSRASVLLRRGPLVVLVAVDQRGGDAGEHALLLARWLDDRLPGGGSRAPGAEPTAPAAPPGQE